MTKNLAIYSWYPILSPNYVNQDRNTLDFNTNLKTIASYKESGFKITVDVTRIVCKRPKDSHASDKQNFRNIFDMAYNKMCECGRQEDFISLLEAIG